MKRLLLILILISIFPSLRFAAAIPQGKPTIDIKKIVLTEEVAKEAYLWGNTVHLTRENKS